MSLAIDISSKMAVQASPSRLSQLTRDNRGAIFVSGLFMMLVVVALMYMVIGVGRTLQAREGMQDAADAAAFSASVFMARGMNLIAMINLLMALLVAVLVAIRLVQTFLLITSVSLFAMSWMGGATAAPAGACMELANLFGDAYSEAKDVIFEALEVMHEVQEGVSIVVPFVAMGAGAIEAAQDHEPALGAFPLPGAFGLPVESDKFPVLCSHATQMATTGTFDAFAQAISIPDSVSDIILGPLRAASAAMGELTSGYLCGAGGSKPPSHEYKVEQGYPKSNGLESCEEDPKSAECKNAQSDLDDAIPLPGTGECAQNCSYDGPYESQARQARSDCQSRRHHRPKSYTWQEVTVDSTWTLTEGQWVESDRSLRNYVLHDQSSTPPCGGNGTIVSQEWNLDSGPRSVPDPYFLCSETPALPIIQGSSSAPISVTYQAVQRLLSCTIKEEKSTPMASPDNQFGEDGGDDDEKTPHRVKEDVELGDESFQVRAIAFGPDVGPASAVDGVKIPLLGKESTSLTDTALTISKLLGAFSIAQSEYYYQAGEKGTRKREDWLWEMRWIARMKRFRLPDSGSDDSEEQSSSEQGYEAEVESKAQKFGVKLAEKSLDGACKALTTHCPEQSDIDLFQSLVIH